jgi:hypothetical protein
MHKERESISLVEKKEKWKHMRQKTIMKQYFINARCRRPRKAHKLGTILKAIALNISFHIL